VDGPSGVSGEVGLGDASSARTKRRHCRRWKAGIKSFAGFSYEFTMPTAAGSGPCASAGTVGRSRGGCISSLSGLTRIEDAE
jgi:hypothetical protein